MPDIENLPVTPDHLCPFLGTEYDAATYSTVSNRPNYCHKARPVAPVSIEQQILICTSDGFRNCPIYSDPLPRRLPLEWSNRAVVEQNKGWVSRVKIWQVLAFSGIALLIFVFLGMASLGRKPNSLASNNMAVKGTVSATDKLKLTPTPTNTPTRRLTSTLTLTAQPIGTITQSAASELLTASAISDQQTQAAFVPPHSQTQTALVSIAGCSLSVSEPEFFPIKRSPPTRLGYGIQPFLIKWTVTNTSQSCKWLLVQLQTTRSGETKILVPMLPGKDQPAIDTEFAMRDENFTLVSQVAPGQTVTIVIQIDGLEIIKNNGKIDRSIDLLINGHLIPAPKLLASIDQWVIVETTTGTPTRTRVPTTR